MVQACRCVVTAKGRNPSPVLGRVVGKDGKLDVVYSSPLRRVSFSRYTCTKCSGKKQLKRFALVEISWEVKEQKSFIAPFLSPPPRGNVQPSSSSAQPVAASAPAPSPAPAPAPAPSPSPAPASLASILPLFTPPLIDKIKAVASNPDRAMLRYVFEGVTASDRIPDDPTIGPLVSGLIQTHSSLGGRILGQRVKVYTLPVFVFRVGNRDEDMVFICVGKNADKKLVRIDQTQSKCSVM
jgi:hypothetical protein